VLTVRSLKPFSPVIERRRKRKGERIFPLALFSLSSSGKEKRDNIAYLKEKEREREK
jgi:hypothetical protein